MAALFFGSLYGFGGFGGGVGFGGGGEQLPRADNDFSQTNPAIRYVGPPYTVGADLSRTPPIYRPFGDGPVSGLFCETSSSAVIGINPGHRPRIPRGWMKGAGVRPLLP
jgi:hypothetical protein